MTESGSCIFPSLRKIEETESEYDETVNCEKAEYGNVEYASRGTKLLTHLGLNALRLNVSSSVLQLNTNNKFQVPNIVHFIWFANESKPFKFHHMLSVLSAHDKINPDLVLFHTNMEPIGHHWDRVRNLTKLRIVPRKPTQCLLGEKVKKPVYETSASDVDRVIILMEYGGIYLDLDVLSIRSFDELRKYPCTIGYENSDYVCGGIIICSSNSPFLLLWLNAFLDDYKVKKWAYNSGRVPQKMIKRYPDLVHIVPEKLHRPGYIERNKLYGEEKYNWRENYSVHLFSRMWPAEKKKALIEDVDGTDKSTFTKWNHTYGDIVRYILYE